MAEPTTADLAKLICTLIASISNLQGQVAALQQERKFDPLAFINRYESYFHQQRIAVEEQVWMASYNLEAGAQMWFLQVQQDEDTPSWCRFSELLNLCFGPPIRSNPLGELMACKRMGFVTEYQDRFEALLPRVGTLTEAQWV
ncbi:uncharacterized protein [Miscanthus floridulus]|uniref:uncharacterized protein n=1 Tax=Miscanthus floridulus TaxID=154761 RepID=UPI00345B2DDA